MSLVFWDTALLGDLKSFCLHTMLKKSLIPKVSL